MPPKPTDALDQISALMAQTKDKAEFDKRLSLIERDLEDYVKETDIHKMSALKIKTYNEQQEKLDGRGINWTAVVQGVLIAVLSGIAMYFATRGAA